MNKNSCDTCGKRTYIHLYPHNPEDMVPVVNEEIIIQKVPTEEPPGSGKLVLKEEKVIKKIQVMTTEKRQNTITGKIESFPVPKFEEKKARTIFVALKIGGERLQRDFCRDCLKDDPKATAILDAAKYLWDLLEGLEPVE